MIPKGTKVLVPYNVRFRSKWRAGMDLGDRPLEYPATIEGEGWESGGNNFYTLRFSDNVIIMGVQENKFTLAENQLSNKKK